MNLSFSVEQSKFSGTPEAIASFSGYPARLRAGLEEVLAEAVDEGYIIATREAPRGPILRRNDGMRVVDSIERGNVGATQGGAGGGATLSRSLIANGITSPHLRFVFEGTGGKEGGGFTRAKSFGPGIGGIEARAAARARGEDIHERVPGSLEIKARQRAQSIRGYQRKDGSQVSPYMRQAGVFAIQKEGETIRYRGAVSGQRAQQDWWNNARDAMNTRMSEGSDRIFDRIVNQRPTT